MYRFSIFVLSVILTVSVSFVSLSKDDIDIPLTTVTPSPAPSKTPTPDLSTSDEGILVEATEVSRSFIEPLTQADLTILTGNVQRPNGAIWYNDKLYTTCSGDWTLYEVDDTSGATTTYIYGVRNSHALYIEDISETEIGLWIPDFDTNSLLRVNRSRSPETIASNLDGPWGIAYLDDDEFLITSLSGNAVILVNRDGTQRQLLDQLRSPTGIAVDEENIYIANNGSARRSIEWISKTDLLEDETPSTQALVSGLQNTTGIVLAEDGFLYFTYSLGTRGVVGRVDPQVCSEQEGCTNNEVEIILYTDLAAPLAGLTISPDMRLFVHTIFRPEIYWVQLDG
jgi:hypothetical protein